MKPNYFSIVILLVSLFLVFIPMVSAQGPAAAGQGAASSATSAVTAEVPRLIKFSGTLLDAQERPVAGPAGVTFALYAQQMGGAALWLETQNVKPDGNGSYTVLLGANSANGVPAELFASGEARWLGVQVERDMEQPRILLVSVPYALKAGDAETLGGLPPSAFARVGNSLAESSNVASSGSLLLPVLTAPAATPFNASTDPTVTTPGGTVNFVPKFDTISDVKTSQIFDNGTDVGIGFPVTPTPIPVAKLDINGSANIRGALTLPATGMATPTLGDNSQPLDLLSSAFSSSTHAAISQHFRWQAEPVGNNTSSPSGKLNLLFASGTGTPGETGLSINNKGQITFASGQTLPTVTGNEAITGNETVNGTVSGSQLISTVANGTAPLKVTSTTLVPNLNASLLDGFPASAFAQLGSSNTFLTSQFIHGGSSNLVGIGDPGCSVGFGAIGFGPNGGLLKCKGWSLLGDGTFTAIGRPIGGSLFFEVAGVAGATADMTITSKGQVGIGTTTPGGQLDVEAAIGSGRAAIRGFGGNGSSTFSGGFGVVGSGGNSSGAAGTFAGIGVEAFGGRGGGDGVTAFGGDSNVSSSNGGNGVSATGGSAAAANVTAGDGIQATGGFATAAGANGGFGILATGGSATVAGAIGGVGIQAKGGSVAVGASPGEGVFAIGGDSSGNGLAAASGLRALGGSVTVSSAGASAGFGIEAVGGNAQAGGLGGFGVFAIGGTNGDGTEARAGEFHGDVEVTGCLGVSPGTPAAVRFGQCLSDVRLKKDIERFSATLDRVVQLQPVTYNWRTEEYPQFRFSSGREIGLIAQEVEGIFPDMVSTDQAGYKRVNYGELPYLMLQAIRELKAESDNLKAENDNLRERIQRLEAVATRTP